MSFAWFFEEYKYFVLEAVISALDCKQYLTLCLGFKSKLNLLGLY